MELQQMRYAIALAEERNFTRAAARCLVVQSALSHQIKALENELGVALFARTSRRVEVTAAGEAFVAAARESIAAADRAAAEAAAAAGQVSGSLTIGVIPTVTAIDIPAALGAFHVRHPGVQIRLRGGSSDEFLAAMAAGGMDVAVLGLPSEITHPLVEMQVLANERLVLVMASDHALGAPRPLQLKDLPAHSYVDFPAGTPGRIQSDRAFAAAGIIRDVAFEAPSTDIMLGLVSNGLAVAFLPRSVVAGVTGVHAVDVNDGPVRVECLAWSGFNPSPAARAFLAGLPEARTKVQGSWMKVDTHPRR